MASLEVQVTNGICLKFLEAIISLNKLFQHSISQRMMGFQKGKGPGRACVLAPATSLPRGIIQHSLDHSGHF